MDYCWWWWWQQTEGISSSSSSSNFFIMGWVSSLLTLHPSNNTSSFFCLFCIFLNLFFFSFFTFHFFICLSYFFFFFKFLYKKKCFPPLFFSWIFYSKENLKPFCFIFFFCESFCPFCIIYFAFLWFSIFSPPPSLFSRIPFISPFLFHFLLFLFHSFSYFLLPLHPPFISSHPSDHSMPVNCPPSTSRLSVCKLLQWKQFPLDYKVLC